MHKAVRPSAPALCPGRSGQVPGARRSGWGDVAVFKEKEKLEMLVAFRNLLLIFRG